MVSKTLVEQIVGWGLVETLVKVVWEDKDVRPQQSKQYDAIRCLL